jgi:Glycosyl hydrolase catalytic core
VQVYGQHEQIQTGAHRPSLSGRIWGHGRQKRAAALVRDFGGLVGPGLSQSSHSSKSRRKMAIQKDDWKNERVQNPLSKQNIEICLAEAECSGHGVDESSIPMRWPLFCWFSCLERPLVPAAETDAATTVNKRQHRELVVCSASLVIVVGIAIAVVTARSNMAARTNEIELSTRPAAVRTVGAESASIGLGDHPPSREDLEACNNELSHPPLPGKKGAAFTLRDAGQSGNWVENLPKVIQLKPYWNYSWGPKRIAQQPDDIEFVPMLWTGNNAASLQVAITNNLMPQKFKAVTPSDCSVSTNRTIRHNPI